MAKKCNCPKTISVLVSRGAKHAARMHENSAAENIYDWPPTDWLLHMKEEEDLIFDELTKRSGTRYWSDLLYEHHQIFRHQIATYGRIDEKLMKEHSKLEDELIEKYF